MKINFSKRQIYILIGVGIVLIAFLSVLFGNIVRPIKKINLTFWGTEDNAQIYGKLISNYKQRAPNVSITYVYKNPINYDQELLTAWASDKGPDIFVLSDKLLGKYKSYIAPLSLTLDQNYTLKNIRDDFPAVIEDNLVYNDYLYGLPLYLDTLALYYNPAYFNYYNIALPPRTWEDAQTLALKFKKLDSYSRISRAGLALGLADNVDRFEDILSILIMQKGGDMTDSNKSSATFDKDVRRYNRNFNPATEALNYYTQFALPNKTTYNWNALLDSSLKAFVDGKVVMVIGYNQDKKYIAEKNPEFEYNIAPLPYFAETDQRISYAQYLFTTVSKKSKNQDQAWQFIKFLSEKEPAKYYYEKTQNPPARRDLISFYQNDPNTGVFIQQALSAKNWYQKDPETVRGILKQTINSIINSSSTLKEAVSLASARINQLLQSK